MIPGQHGLTTSVVVDASVLVDLLAGTERAAAVSAALSGGQALHAPTLIDTEVLSALRRIERHIEHGGGSASARMGDAIEDFARLDVRRHPVHPLNELVWSLRGWARAADGYYVALAAAMRAPLMTCDRRLARAVQDRNIVEVVEPEQWA